MAKDVTVTFTSAEFTNLLQYLADAEARSEDALIRCNKDPENIQFFITKVDAIQKMRLKLVEAKTGK